MTSTVITAAFDIETSGLDVKKSDILEIAIVPLNKNYEPDSNIPEFSARIKAENPEYASAKAMAINKLDLNKGEARKKVSQDIKQWMQDNDVKFIHPLAHNISFDLKFFRANFPELSRIFSGHGRDSMQLAIAINDVSVLKHGAVKFESVSLSAIMAKLGFNSEVTHQAVSDACDSARVYKKLLDMIHM